MRKPLIKSAKKEPLSKKRRIRLYSLFGTELDLPTAKILSLTPNKRRSYIKSLLFALADEIRHDRLSLKSNIYFDEEMADYRKILKTAPDQYNYVEDGKKRRWVLGKGAPGDTHIYWSSTQIWKMKTKQGSLTDQIIEQSPSLFNKLDALFDIKNKSKAGFRKKDMAIQCVLSFLQFDKSSGAAFPPFHARYLANKYLPKQGDCIVFDPCAGWGGRLLGSLLVNRKDKVTYYGVDPALENQEAYDGLTRRVTHYLAKEVAGPRHAEVFPKPFEDFIKTKKAQRLFGKVDFAITSPPYFTAENYNSDDSKQSANRYPEYDNWRDNFYRPLIQGTYDLLKPGGHFALNVADVEEAPFLERDASDIAKQVGFHWAGFYKLAMSISPAQRKAGTARHVVSVDGKLFKHEPLFLFKKPLSNERSNMVHTERQKTTFKSSTPALSKAAVPNNELPNLGNWKDPFPAPRIERIEGFYVVRDDLLEYGSKIRFLDYLISTSPEKEFVYGGSNKIGWGAISLAYLCQRYGKKAICFMARSNTLTWHQEQFKELGGKIVPVEQGRLVVTEKRAKEYVTKKPRIRRLMPMGMNDPTVLASIVKVAQSLPIAPKEIWTVASSGTLSRGLQLAFPKAKVFAVQVGHTLTQKEVAKATILKSSLQYDKRAPEEELPPYPSEPYYDAKLWKFVKQKGSKNALIWNVA